MDDNTSTASPLSDRLSITALAISLVALIIGASSFLQAILGTAEGYRRCAKSVIGPWSSLRRREFRPSELRLETKFVTPLIVIVSPYDLQQAQESGLDSLYLLNPPPGDNQDSSRTALARLLRRRPNAGQVLDESVHWPEFTSVSRFTGVDHDPKALRAIRASETVEEVVKKFEVTVQPYAPTLRLEAGYEHSGKHGRRQGPRNGLPVTWIRMLRDLHLLYMNYWPTEQRSCENACRLEESTDSSFHFSQTAEDRARVLDTAQRHMPEWQNDARTRVAIIPVEETWDFMPPDVSRPLASSTIGFTVVLAIRLGMQWRTLDRARSQLNADGNGFNITSTDVKGMGIVLKFNSFSQHEKEGVLEIIPSRAVDKLMCGIVPGDPRLVQHDYPMVGPDRKCLSICDAGSILEELGLPPDDIKDIRQQDRWTTPNEVITMLCTFLPLPTCYLTSFYFPGWRAKQYNVFHFFESRTALYFHLKDPDFKSSATTSWIRDQLDYLTQHFGFEFCKGYYEDTPPDLDSIQRSIRLREWLAGRFRDTTKHFLHLGYHHKNGASKTWYAQLVAAHARLSAFCTHKVPVDQRDQTIVLEEFGPIIKSAKIKTEYFAERWYNLAKAYADHASDATHGIEAYMRERSFVRQDKIIDRRSTVLDDWWMLIFRAIVWDMSCEWIDLPGEPVPSSYYDDETSVWFT